MSEIIQTRIKDLLNEYLPAGTEDFSGYYVAVDSAEFSEANKMPLSVLLTAGSIKYQTGSGTSTANSVSVTFDNNFTNNEFFLSLNVYRVETVNGDTVYTNVPIKNILKTSSGFSFEGYESGLTYDFFAIE